MNIASRILLTATFLAVAALATPARAQTAASPATNWQNTATVGLTIARGNTDTTLFSASLESEKKWAHSDLRLGADDIYGETKTGNSPSSETADAEHAYIQYNRDVSDRFFLYARATGMHDGIADVQYRLTLAPGAGYYFIKNKKLDLSLEGGPGYIAQKLGHQYSSYVTLRLAQKLHWQISDRAKMWESLEYMPQVDEFGNYLVNFELGVEAALNKSNKLALRTVFQDTYDSKPAVDRLKNDLKLIAGITYHF
jgi:putative salt-induced outer membrane protein